ncbi:phosphotransferase [Alkalicella caledoniensis]|uniref:Phosphotransferase n=1 Tax=Alkalicella caledoniensis TaxID=2731377 RepID=A0A7G9WCZ7_ALKCA|nr:phosphotransferase [Alkalicella caledoniensis]
MVDGKVLGIGNTATVYKLSNEKVLKLFNKGYPKDAVEREFSNAKMIEKMGFLKPQAYEMIKVEGQMGIIYDMVQGYSLVEWVMRTGNVEECASLMAKLHKEILDNSVDKVPDYKGLLKHDILRARNVDPVKLEKILQKLNALPEGDVLCHGDFHPGNIMISNGKPAILDFMNICRGVYLFDVARTVFLVEYTPVPNDIKDKEMLLKLKVALADSYLREMNVSRNMIQDYLDVIDVARRGECPEEERRSDNCRD